jgi:ABC-type sugar transport system ATPase subunit
VERRVVLEVKGLCKYFGGIRAVNNVDLKLYGGEIIAIVGDNGAGKSTLIKVVSGVYKKNSGEIYVNGKKTAINDPNDAKRLGIETVYQEQAFIPTFDASLNLFLGREKLQKNKFGKLFNFLDFKYMRRETEDLLEKIGVKLKDANAHIMSLSGGQRQSISVGRAVYWEGKVLIFDEPTNNLGAIQERKVVDLIKKIRDIYNVSIIVISHNIAHVFALVDRIIVLRNGIKVGERMKDKTNPNEIVSLITGVLEQ